MQTRHRAQKLIAATGPTIAVLLAVIGCTTTHDPAPLAPAAVATPAATPTAAPAPAPPTCTASVTRKHPADGTKVGISVTTVPGARITAVAHFPAGNHKKTARADSAGLHTFWFQVGSATPGYRVKATVRVSAHGQKRSCRAAFTHASHLLRSLPPRPLRQWPLRLHLRRSITRVLGAPRASTRSWITTTTSGSTMLRALQPARHGRHRQRRRRLVELLHQRLGLRGHLPERPATRNFDHRHRGRSDLHNK